MEIEQIIAICLLFILTLTLYINLWKSLKIVQKWKSRILDYYLYAQDPQMAIEQSLCLLEDELNIAKPEIPLADRIAQQMGYQNPNADPEEEEEENSQDEEVLMKIEEDDPKDQALQPFYQKFRAPNRVHDHHTYDADIQDTHVFNKSFQEPQESSPTKNHMTAMNREYDINKITQKVNFESAPGLHLYLFIKVFGLYMWIFSILFYKRRNLVILPLSISTVVSSLYYFIFFVMQIIWFNNSQNTELTDTLLLQDLPMLVILCCSFDYLVINLCFEFYKSNMIIHSKEKIIKTQICNEQIEHERKQINDDPQTVARIQNATQEIALEMFFLIFCFIIASFFVIGIYLIFEGKTENFDQFLKLYAISIGYQQLIKFVYCLFICYYRKRIIINYKIDWEADVFREIYDMYKEDLCIECVEQFKKLNLLQKIQIAGERNGQIKEDVEDEDDKVNDFRGQGQDFGARKFMYKKQQQTNILADIQLSEINLDDQQEINDQSMIIPDDFLDFMKQIQTKNRKGLIGNCCSAQNPKYQLQTSIGTEVLKKNAIINGKVQVNIDCLDQSNSMDQEIEQIKTILEISHIEDVKEYEKQQQRMNEIQKQLDLKIPGMETAWRKIKDSKLKKPKNFSQFKINEALGIEQDEEFIKQFDQQYIIRPDDPIVVQLEELAQPVQLMPYEYEIEVEYEKQSKIRDKKLKLSIIDEQKNEKRKQQEKEKAAIEKKKNLEIRRQKLLDENKQIKKMAKLKNASLVIDQEKSIKSRIQPEISSNLMQSRLAKSDLMKQLILNSQLVDSRSSSPKKQIKQQPSKSITPIQNKQDEKINDEAHIIEHSDASLQYKSDVQIHEIIQ